MTSSETSKVFSGSKPSTRFVAATSSSPSAEPCEASVFWACGAGQAMIERAAMNDGRSVSALAAWSAANRPAGSRSPLGSCSTRWTCQPYASYRFRVSSETAVSVSPSMEMWLSSHSRTRLPSFWCPASEDASAEMPSWRQPSPATTQTMWSNGEVPGAASGSNRPRSYREAIAMPTALATPWPSGPVVVSTPVVWPYSG